jgi:hypothetical protein
LIHPGERCGFGVLDTRGRAKLCGKPPTCERMIEEIAFTACDACAARHDAGERVRAAHLDFGDRAAVRAWLADLRAVMADSGAVAADMLRPLRKRKLGHREHARLHAEAREALAQLLAYAGAPPEEPEPSDPAGCGGSPAL